MSNSDSPFHVLLPRLPAGLPDPASARHLAELLAANCPEVAGRLLSETATARHILELFSFSPGIGRILAQQGELLEGFLPFAKTGVEEFARKTERLEEELVARHGARRGLRLFKAAAFGEILVADIGNLDGFEETVAKISRVADLAVRRAYQETDLGRFGAAVIALGKWGGVELNYSSDIDLVFVLPDSCGPEEVAAAQRAAADFSRFIEERSADGYAFKVDLQIRPEGGAGALVRTLRQYLIHYREAAMSWEFQALLKARFATGDAELARAFLEAVRPLVFHRGVSSELLLQEVGEMKRKIEQDLVVRRTEGGNIKLGSGGIRDIEFIVQFLQLHHGRSTPGLEEGATLPAMRKLFAHSILTPHEVRTLRAHYVFLRRVEHLLQIAELTPVRQLPASLPALEILARKAALILGGPRGRRREWLLRRYAKAAQETRAIFFEIFDVTIAFLKKRQEALGLLPKELHFRAYEHFARLESDYFLRFSAEEIAQHVRMTGRLAADNLVEIAWSRRGSGLEMTMVAYDYAGEFSKICGLLSAHGFNIASGESYTYSPPEEEAARGPARAFYRRPLRRYTRAPHASAESRLLVCAVRVDPPRGETPRPFEAAFREELAQYLEMLKEGRQREASERLTLRVMERLRGGSGGFAPRRGGLVEIAVDNESDRTYTILEITSPDSFMFLFEFTSALTARDYYIGKVEIRTERGMARDRLFITTRQGRKILDARGLFELKSILALIKHFAHTLRVAPNPALALQQFSGALDLLVESSGAGAVEGIARADVLENLARVLGSGTAIGEDLVRHHPDLFLPAVMDARQLDEAPTPEGFARRLAAKLAPCRDALEAVDAMNLFKDTERFRLDLRHLTRRVVHFTDFCRELSVLADTVMLEALKLAIAESERRLGTGEPGRCCLLALGKWGGYEIGYASDIELMFVYDAGERPVSEVMEFYEHSARFIVQSVRSRPGGLFELDFRLRPDGEKGPLAISFSRFASYYAPGGGAANFERQALIRLRPVAGDEELRRRVQRHRDLFVFGPAPFDVANMKHLRYRQQTELVAPGDLNAKYSAGGLLDAEYFVQALQIRSGGASEALRQTNTRAAAAALKEAGCMSGEQHAVCEEGYRFLRAIINALRIVRGNARDLVIPRPDTLEFRFLFRRLENFEHLPKHEELWDYILEQMRRVHGLFESLE